VSVASQYSGASTEVVQAALVLAVFRNLTGCQRDAESRE
jgi:hypothetical protein